MTLVKIHAFDQNTFIGTGGGPAKDGICYYMCNYVEANIWKAPITYAGGKTKATDFGNYGAMVNYAKAQNVQKYAQKSYASLSGTHFSKNSLYRVGVWIGDHGSTPGNPNHELIMITGPHNEIVFFDPNFGFYEIQAPSNENLNDFKAALAQLYGSIHMDVSSYEFMKVRSLSV